MSPRGDPLVDEPPQDENNAAALDAGPNNAEPNAANNAGLDFHILLAMADGFLPHWPAVSTECVIALIDAGKSDALRSLHPHVAGDIPREALLPLCVAALHGGNIEILDIIVNMYAARLTLEYLQDVVLLDRIDALNVLSPTHAPLLTEGEKIELACAAARGGHVEAFLVLMDRYGARLPPEEVEKLAIDAGYPVEDVPPVDKERREGILRAVIQTHDFDANWWRSLVLMVAHSMILETMTILHTLGVGLPELPQHETEALLLEAVHTEDDSLELVQCLLEKFQLIPPPNFMIRLIEEADAHDKYDVVEYIKERFPADARAAHI